jgi:H+/Cl- antiporter ClcA
VLQSLFLGSPFSLSTSATLKFGHLLPEESTLLDIPAGLAIGAICGVIGSVFIYVNVVLGNYRKKYVNSKCRKISEALLFALSTSVVFFLVTLTRKDECLKEPTG